MVKNRGCLSIDDCSYGLHSRQRATLIVYTKKAGLLPPLNILQRQIILRLRLQLLLLPLRLLRLLRLLHLLEEQR